MSVSGSQALSERSVLITGAGRGLGRTFAEGFAASGARIVVADVDRAAAEQTAAALAGGGREAVAVEVDVADEASTYVVDGGRQFL